MFRKAVFVGLLMACTSMPAAAQDIATRILNMENRINELTGQIEELNNSMRQLQKQLGSAQQQGSLEPAVPAPQPKLKKLGDVAAADDGQGVEAIVDEPAAMPAAKPKKRAVLSGAESIETTDLAGATAAEPAIGEDVADAGTAAKSLTMEPAEPAIGEQPVDGTVAAEPVSLKSEDEQAKELYAAGNELMLRQKFAEAETSFTQFLERHPDHQLAGNALYWKGEAQFSQRNYQDAARSYLTSYKNHPKGRRAPDSLVKLGVSLLKLGEKEKGCAAFSDVSVEFPKAAEMGRRARVEAQRAGC
jgi:tol-pal system protein YbgF